MDLEGQIINSCYIVGKKIEGDPFHRTWEARALYSAEIFFLKFIRVSNNEISNPDSNSYKQLFLSTYKDQSSYLRLPFELSEYKGYIYTAFQKTEEVPLSIFIQENKDISYRSALTIIIDIVHGLMDLQKYIISHNLLSPGYVWLSKKQLAGGHARITDFDIHILKPYIKLADNHEWSDRKGYFSHRVLESSIIESSFHNDIYSTGAIFYRMLTDKLPYHASTMAELVKKQKQGKPEQFPEDRSNIPKKIVELVYKMLHPSFPFSDLEELFEELSSLQPGKKVDRLYTGTAAMPTYQNRSESMEDTPEYASWLAAAPKKIEIASDPHNIPQEITAEPGNMKDSSGLKTFWKKLTAGWLSPIKSILQTKNQKRNPVKKYGKNGNETRIFKGFLSFTSLKAIVRKIMGFFFFRWKRHNRNQQEVEKESPDEKRRPNTHTGKEDHFEEERYRKIPANLDIGEVDSIAYKINVEGTAEMESSSRRALVEKMAEINSQRYMTREKEIAQDDEDGKHNFFRTSEESIYNPGSFLGERPAYNSSPSPNGFISMEKNKNSELNGTTRNSDILEFKKKHVAHGNTGKSPGNDKYTLNSGIYKNTTRKEQRQYKTDDMIIDKGGGRSKYRNIPSETAGMKRLTAKHGKGRKKQQRSFWDWLKRLFRKVISFFL